MEKHPAYRLMDGRIVCQQESGARWMPVDDKIVEEMLKVFKGIPLDALEQRIHNLLRRTSG